MNEEDAIKCLEAMTWDDNVNSIPVSNFTLTNDDPEDDSCTVEVAVERPNKDTVVGKSGDATLEITANLLERWANDVNFDVLETELACDFSKSADDLN